MVAAEFHAKPYEILISDDDESCRESVREALEPHGYLTHVVSSGREAIEVVRRHLVHVIIVDMNMPDLNGVQTITIIHQEIHAAVPGILMSADNSSELIARAEEARFDSFVPKPIDLGTLRRAVEQVLRRYYADQ